MGSPQPHAAGALSDREYESKLGAAGFEHVEVEPWRVYEQHGGQFVSAFVRATKPAAKTAKSCCGPECCA